MGLKRYKYDDWDFKYETEEGLYDLELRTYIDKQGNPITGILEDFYYFKEGDPRNNVEFKDGKRVH